MLIQRLPPVITLLRLFWYFSSKLADSASSIVIPIIGCVNVRTMNKNSLNKNT
jgi:hypothetical protein